MVEVEIKAEMTNAQGMVLYDAWARAGTHNLGVFANYIMKDIIIVNGADLIQDVVKSALLSASPMAHSDNVSNEQFLNDVEATEFYAETHLEKMIALFSNFGLNFDEWVLC